MIAGLGCIWKRIWIICGAYENCTTFVILLLYLVVFWVIYKVFRNDLNSVGLLFPFTFSLHFPLPLPPFSYSPSSPSSSIFFSYSLLLLFLHFPMFLLPPLSLQIPPSSSYIFFSYPLLLPPISLLLILILIHIDPVRIFKKKNIPIVYCSSHSLV